MGIEDVSSGNLNICSPSLSQQIQRKSQYVVHKRSACSSHCLILFRSCN